MARKSSEEVSAIDRVLSQDVFFDINKQFEGMRTKTGHNRKGKPKQGRKAEPKWYQPLGLKSIRDIAVEVGRLHEYDIYYSQCSNVTHASSYRNHVRLGAGRVHFQPIRDLGDISIVFLCTTVSALKTYRSVINRYLPQESEVFLRRYTEEWREAIDTVVGLRIGRRVHPIDIDG